MFDPGPVTPSHSGIDAYEPVGEFGRQEKVERNVHKPGGLSLPLDDPCVGMQQVSMNGAETGKAPV